MAKSDQILVAKESGVTNIKGVDYPYVKGTTHIRGNHPLARAVPENFEPAQDAVSYDVVSATAAPGEQRGEEQAAKAEKKSEKAEKQAEKQAEKSEKITDKVKRFGK